MLFRRLLPLLLPLAFCAAGLVAAAPAVVSPTPPASPTAGAPADLVDEAFFTREIQPILQKSCLGCHGVQAKLSGLDLRSRLGALKGGTRGPSLLIGSSARSTIYQFVSGARGPMMPPTGKLPAAQVAKIKRWLDGGAPWPDGATDTADAQVWWSFKAPARVTPPRLKNAAWVRNPIDAFVLEELRSAGLSPSPPAARRVLIRRAYLDLVGLPPTPDEVRAFEADRSPDAWEKVVDRLLASKHYGERWARHWLDLVRYADSCGFEGDKDRPNAWRYRDYVIDSFNRDKPYDRFIKEQLAGDEIGPNDRDCLIATGFLGCGLEDFAMVKLPPARADELDDLVATTTSVMLGLTVGCARCHDHKYDPVKQTDYYRIQALFAPTERREAPVPTDEERKAIEAREAEVQAQLAPLKARLDPLRQKGTTAAIAAGQAKPTDDQIAAALPEQERKELTDLTQQVKAVEAKRLPMPMAVTVTDKKREWEPVHLLTRGDAYHPAQVVQPGFIVSLPGGASEVAADAATPQTTGRRRALAEWIGSDKNPLTARVWMNRVWRQHFGRGLVNSVSNFGVNGELPTHPELLDWLANAFTSGDTGTGKNADPWSLKPMHRLMLLSNTYQQSTTQRPDAMTKDPENRLLWRMPVRRLEAEAIRDSILAVAGSLNPEMGGPPIYPPVDASLRADTFQGVNWPEGEDSFKTWRRSVYVKVKRSLIFPQLEVFDCPEITASVPKRNVTTSPTQALTMLNDPLIQHQSALFAERVLKEAGVDPRRQIERAYQLAFGRAPTEREIALALAFMKQSPTTPERSRLADFCHAVINLNEFVYAP